MRTSSNIIYISEEDFFKLKEGNFSKPDSIYMASNHKFGLKFSDIQLALLQIPYSKDRKYIEGGYYVLCTKLNLVTSSGHKRASVSLVQFIEKKVIAWRVNGTLILEKDGKRFAYQAKYAQGTVYILYSDFKANPNSFVRPDDIFEKLNSPNKSIKSVVKLVKPKPEIEQKPDAKQNKEAEAISLASLPPLKEFQSDLNILYIHKGNIICLKNEHPVEAVTIELANINSQNFPITMQVFYCHRCKKYFIHNTVYEYPEIFMRIFA